MLRYQAILLPLLLAACGGAGSNITISDSEGNVAIVTDAEGRTRVKAPGVDISARLPQLKIDAKDFDVSGMKLYPGTTIRDINITADTARNVTGSDRDHVQLSFDAPAPLATVQAWYRDAMAKQGFKVTASGNGLAGTTDEGEQITLQLEANGADKSRGSLRVGA